MDAKTAVRETRAAQFLFAFGSIRQHFRLVVI